MKLLRYSLLSLLLFVLLVAFWQAKPSIQVSKVAGAAESFRAQEPAKALSAMPTTISGKLDWLSCSLTSPFPLHELKAASSD
jgi:hypothetical protein